MKPGENRAEMMPTPYTTETNTPTSSPGTLSAAATAGAMAGSENSAMVASVCAARVAISGQSGMRILSSVVHQHDMQTTRAMRAEFEGLLDVGGARWAGDQHDVARHGGQFS